MKNIKGPKSALSDFLKESNIKITNKKQNSILSAPVVIQKKKQKKAKLNKPFELVNSETIRITEEDKILEMKIDDINGTEISDELLDQIAMFLSRKRRMTKAFFDNIVGKCQDSLSLYDCSMIKDSDFNIFKKLKKLELFQCGQLTENTLNCILDSMKELKILRLTGAFLLESFRIPKGLNILDVSNCSRLNDSFIEELNGNDIEELRLSYCYGLTKQSYLKIQVQRLFICETRLTEKFYSGIKILKYLSIKRCPNINILIDISELEFLDVEGIVTLSNITPSHNLLHLCISDCPQIKSLDFPNLIHLNASNSGLDQNMISQILKMENLIELDISWNTFINDTVLKQLIEKIKTLKKISVFGCFNLTKESVDFTYNSNVSCKVIGNPAETKYLLDETI